MLELLGPNVARTIMGDAYNPDFRYELETDDNGFHVIITNIETKEFSSVELSAQEADPEKLSSIWKDDLSGRLPKKGLLNKLLFWFCIAAAIVCVIAVFLGLV